MKKILTVVTLIALLFSFAACTQLNEEKDNARVIAEIDGEEILKSAFKDYFRYYEVIYTTSNYTLPAGKQLTEFKRTLLDEFVRFEVQYREALARGYELPEDTTYLDDVDATLESIASSVGEDRIEKFYADLGTSEEEFKLFLTDYLMKAIYVQQMQQDLFTILNEDETYSTYEVATVNGHAMIMEEFMYYTTMDIIKTYLYGSSTPTTAEAWQEFYATTINDYANLDIYRIKAEELAFEITEEEIEERLKDIMMYYDMLGDDEEQKEEFLNSQLLTKEQWDKYARENAALLVAQDKVLTYFKEQSDTYEPTEKEIQEYYDANIGTVEGQTMYAKHILFEADYLSEAEALAKRAQAGEDFDSLIAEYKEAEGVKEASDLRRFDTARMVEAFSTAAFALKPGEVSGVVESEFGYHIIYAYEAPSLEDSTADIIQTLKDSHLSGEADKQKEALLDTVKVKTEDTIRDANNLFIEHLLEKFNVKTYPNRVK